MNIIVDACVGMQVVEALEADGHDVDYIAQMEKSPDDDDILREAHKRQQVLVTRDKDFGVWAVLHGLPHCGIVQFRKLPLRHQAAACRVALRNHGGDLLKGAIVTIQPGRVRVRRSGGK